VVSPNATSPNGAGLAITVAATDGAGAATGP